MSKSQVWCGLTNTVIFFLPSSGGNMAASLGFPFTNAQWNELERQAMIYKYMVSSNHVPPHLLIPTPLSTAKPLNFFLIVLGLMSFS
jgi:hypothetical protein